MREVDAALRGQLGLFPEVEGFQRARLFRGDDGACLLDVECLVGGRLSRQLLPLSPSGVDSLQQAVARHLAQVRPLPARVQSARGELVFDHVVLSLLIYGPAAPAILGLDGARTSLAAYMLTSAGGFYLPYRLTRDRDVTPSHRTLSQYGATRGIAYGLLLGHLLVGDLSKHSGPAFVAGTSIATSAAGFRAADRRRPSHGHAQLLGVCGDFGLLTGAGLAHATGLYGGEDDISRAGDAVTLLGAGTGLALGERLGRQHPYTRGDALVLRSASIAGALVALPLVNATGTESSRAHAGGLVAGQAAGLAAGHRLLAVQEFEFGEGILVASGQLAGALLGLGLTYLADTGGDFDELVYMTSAAAGSTAGFTLGFRLFAR